MPGFSDRLNRLPPYLFTRITQLKKEAYAKKLDVIDLGMGNPDQPTPASIVERLCDTVQNHVSTHRYPQAKGIPKFRKTIAAWMQKRFGVDLSPDNEITALIGSKEGIAHLAMAVLNPDEAVLVGNPSYPAHFNGVILAGGEVHSIPLRPENDYLPDLGKIPEKVIRKSKLLFLNYPNNPTTAVVPDKAVFQDWVRFAKKYDLIVCSPLTAMLRRASWKSRELRTSGWKCIPAPRATTWPDGGSGGCAATPKSLPPSRNLNPSSTMARRPSSSSRRWRPWRAGRKPSIPS
jgi:LL-diaminopimelate aminotransferase